MLLLKLLKSILKKKCKNVYVSLKIKCVSGKFSEL